MQLASPSRSPTLRKRGQGQVVSATGALEVGPRESDVAEALDADGLAERITDEAEEGEGFVVA
jgi:hypothetical protein